MVDNTKIIKRLSDIKLRYYYNVTKLKINDVKKLMDKYENQVLYSLSADHNDFRMYNIYKDILFDLYQLKKAYADEIHIREVSDKNLEDWING